MYQIHTLPLQQEIETKAEFEASGQVAPETCRTERDCFVYAQYYHID